MTEENRIAPGSAPETPSVRKPGMEPDPSSEGSLAAYSFLFMGPLPPPGTLRDYEGVSPGAADRILSMAEAQQAHRHRIESEVVAAGCRSQDRGLILGFTIALAVIGVSVLCIWQDKDLFGLTALVGGLAAAVGPFLYAHRQQKRELTEKKQKVLAKGSDNA